MLPEITPGAEGKLLTEIVRATLLAQELFAVTEIFPLVNVEAKFTIKLVPLVTIGDAPTVEVIPAGNVQVYVVAPAAAATVYVEDVKPQVTSEPLTDAGADGTVIIANVLAALLAHELFAVTETVPEINVDANTTGKLVTLVIIGEVPIDEVTPVGNIQV